VLLFTLVALGLLALRMPDQHVKDEQYQKDANDSGGQDAWPLSSTRQYGFVLQQPGRRGGALAVDLCLDQQFFIRIICK